MRIETRCRPARWCLSAGTRVSAPRWVPPGADSGRLLGVPSSTCPEGRFDSESSSGVRRRLGRAALQRRPLPGCSGVRISKDSVALEIADYAATVEAVVRGDSLIGAYRNVGNRGPRVIPFRAARGRGQSSRRPPGCWAGGMRRSSRMGGSSPRVFELRNGPAGLEGTIISNSGDYGPFWGRAAGEQLRDRALRGSYVYLLTGQLERRHPARGLSCRPSNPDAMDGGAEHRAAPPQGADRDHVGRHHRTVSVSAFPTAGPDGGERRPALPGQGRAGGHLRYLVPHLPRRRSGAASALRSVSSARAGDGGAGLRGHRRHRGGRAARFAATATSSGIPFPLLLAGISDVEGIEAALPQLRGVSAFPTTIFLGRDGRVRGSMPGSTAWRRGPSTGGRCGSSRRRSRDC